MSIIFDRFPNVGKATEFLAAVKQRYGVDGQLFMDEESAMEHDPFPWKLDPPIVHVDRNDDVAVEVEIEALVQEYGGTCAGT